MKAKPRKRGPKRISAAARRAKRTKPPEPVVLEVHVKPVLLPPVVETPFKAAMRRLREWLAGG